MENANICQSCGMPLNTQEEKGTGKDGSASEEYCVHCYKDGEFTQDISLEEMTELNLQYLEEWNKENDQEYRVEDARAELNRFLPTLKRWRKGN